MKTETYDIGLEPFTTKPIGEVLGDYYYRLAKGELTRLTVIVEEFDKSGPPKRIRVEFEERPK